MRQAHEVAVAHYNSSQRRHYQTIVIQGVTADSSSGYAEAAGTTQTRTDMPNQGTFSKSGR